jgi:glycosyltransferase involved in cell wall biosynthesis
MQKIKVLHIITGLNAGGAERVVYDLCMNLNPTRFTNTVVVMSEKEKLLPLFVEADIPVITLKMKRNLFSFFHGLVSIRKLIVKEKPDIIHAHMYHAMVTGVFLKVLFKDLPLVFTPHNIAMGNLVRDLTSYLLKNFRNCDILFSSRHKRYFLKKKNRIIPNGILIKEVLNEKKFETFTFLMIGRLEPVKNHLAILPIIRKLRTKHEFRLLIAGTGYLEEKIKAKIRVLQLEDTVELLGFRTDIPVLCAKSHVVLMPSIYEGLPIALLEAGLAKLPVISTPVGSIPDLIDNETGYLAEINEFERVISYVIEHYDEAKGKGGKLHSRIRKQFNIEQIALLHESLYTELTSLKK